ncbi:hypothetical protein, partial [Streptomyces zhihengii]
HEGLAVPVPRPSEVPHLRPFVWAYDDMTRLVAAPRTAVTGRLLAPSLIRRPPCARVVRAHRRGPVRACAPLPRYGPARPA